VGWDRGFTGYVADNETGLLHARARQYSPTLGRFVGRDPVRYVDGFLLYMAYFAPNSSDPSGLYSEECKGLENVVTRAVSWRAPKPKAFFGSSPCHDLGITAISRIVNEQNEKWMDELSFDASQFGCNPFAKCKPFLTVRRTCQVTGYGVSMIGDMQLSEKPWPGPPYDGLTAVFGAGTRTLTIQYRVYSSCRCKCIEEAYSEYP